MRPFRRRLADIQVAVLFLTRLPAGSVSSPVPTLANAAWAYPLVGLVTGCAVWGVLILTSGLHPTLSAILAVSALVMLTGALHHDGLADCADGLGGGRDRAHVLEIMRDSRIGSYGVVAIVLVLALQVASLSAVTVSLLPFLFVAVGSRLIMVAVLVALPPARADGLGQSAAVGWAALLPGIIIWLLLISVSDAPFWVFAAMCLPVVWLAHRTYRRIQGQTGDVLGASQILAETAGWIALTL
jgi:adenosylcobinamide-GDP ribazoletransferase